MYFLRLEDTADAESFLSSACHSGSDRNMSVGSCWGHGGWSEISER